MYSDVPSPRLVVLAVEIIFKITIKLLPKYKWRKGKNKQTRIYNVDYVYIIYLDSHPICSCCPH